MYVNSGYYRLVCFDCKEEFSPRFCKLWDYIGRDSGLAWVGRFMIAHNGHRIALVNTDDPEVDWDTISSFNEVPDFEIRGRIKRLINKIYPKASPPNAANQRARLFALRCICIVMPL